MLVAIVAIALVFGLLFLARTGGGHRRMVARYGPPLALGALAAWMVLREQYWVGAVVGCAALAAWQFGDPKPRPAPIAPDPRDAYARAVLGVGPNATAAEIKAAFRAKMATAHPDRGGAHDAAAKLVAARDRLLHRR